MSVSGQCGPLPMWTKTNVDLDQCGPNPMWTTLLLLVIVDHIERILVNVDHIEIFWSMWTPLKYFGQCGPPKNWHVFNTYNIKYYLRFGKLGYCGAHNLNLVIVDHIIKTRSMWTKISNWFSGYN